MASKIIVAHFRAYTKGKFLQRCFSKSLVRCDEMNDPLEHATGIEKREMLAKATGEKDPFGLNRIIKRGPSTKDNPTLIPSAFEGRLVGCICNDDQRYAQWMWLEKGCPKRCECGYWFMLQEVHPF